MGTSQSTDSKTQTSNKASQTVAKGGSFASKPPQPQAGTTAVDYSTLANVSKAALTRIEATQLPKKTPDFTTPGATKDALIAEWLKTWIASGLKSGKLTDQNILPRKADIAQHLSVSVGTVQNAIRYIEDDGVVESKQRIGTIICNPESSAPRLRKQTSKREQAVTAIAQWIIEKGYQPGALLPSAREIAKVIGSAPNTTRLALEYLSQQGTLQNLGTRGNRANWLLNEIPTVDSNAQPTAIESETLIDQLERDLKIVLEQRYTIGEKLPSHLDLANLFKVSIKTVHDAMKRLNDQGIVMSKRGRYGTFLVRKPDTDKLVSEADKAMFVPVDESAGGSVTSTVDASFYNYEKAEAMLKVMIAEQFKPGDKLPAMSHLAEAMDVSSNTIRKALQQLAEQNIVEFKRGRYGGTFVQQTPSVDQDLAEQAKSRAGQKGYQWVSINPKAVDATAESR